MVNGFSLGVSIFCFIGMILILSGNPEGGLYFGLANGILGVINMWWAFI